MEDRPLRHGGDPPRVRGVGHRLPSTVPRHVRDRAMGRQSPRALARPRPDRHQAALLQHPPRPDHLRIRDQGAAPGPRSAAGCPRGGVLPLPLVPDDTGAADALRRHSKAAGGTWLRVKRGRHDHGAALLGRVGHADPLIGMSEDEIAEPMLDELRTAVRLRKVSDVPVGVFLSGRDRLQHERGAVLGRGDAGR